MTLVRTFSTADEEGEGIGDISTFTLGTLGTAQAYAPVSTLCFIKYI